MIVAVITAFVVAAWKYRAVLDTGTKSVKWIAFVNGRASRIEENMITLTKTVSDMGEIVKRELTTNGGASMKDVMIQTRDIAHIAAARANAISNHSRFSMFECDPSGKCVFANESLCEMFGLDRAEMIEYGWLGAIVDEERAATNDAWAKAVKEHIPYSWNYHIKNRRTGEIVACSAHAHPVVVAGKIIAYTGTVKSIDP